MYEDEDGFRCYGVIERSGSNEERNCDMRETKGDREMKTKKCSECGKVHKGKCRGY